ncbi:MAG: hypothetical protein ACK4TA_17030 [Saprospiraceae bacterium]
MPSRIASGTSRIASGTSRIASGTSRIASGTSRIAPYYALKKRDSCFSAFE